jgi:branched-chain amino acid transport system substrate-binding protein
MMKKSLAVLPIVIALALTGCAAGDPGGGGSSDEPVRIGASLPLTGALASFGTVLQAGYQAAVDEINDAGGLDVGGTARPVELVVLDSASDPNTVAEQTRTLVLQDEVVGLLGSVSPGLTIPASNIADLEKIPMVSTLTPNQAWKAGNAAGWQYAWNLFLDEAQLIEASYQAADLADTNKKVAIFADTEEDGIATGGLWESEAESYGYEVVYRADFPALTTDFTAFINQAKAAGAEVLLGTMIPPDSFALWKQMKALAYTPAVAFCQKCNSQAAFQGALGELAEGTSVAYLATSPTDGPFADLRAAFAETYGDTVDLSSALASYSAAKVLLDAITTAGTTDADAVNEAIGATDTDYPIGPVKFDDGHAYAAPVAALQWQGTAQVQVFPEGVGTLTTPVTGLQ